MGLPYKDDFRVTSIQGPRWGEPHRGLDAVGKDKNIYAVRDGTVEISSIITDKRNPSWAFGNRVWFRDKKGLIVCNNHFAERKVEARQRIKEGDLIGIEGATGHCVPEGASHLHFEIRDRLGAGFVNLSAAEYLGIQNVVGLVRVSAAPPKADPPKVDTSPLKHGDKVNIIATTSNGRTLYGSTYTGALFRIYHDVYNVIGDPKGDRVVIGIGSIITAAVKAADLEKLS